MGLILANYGCGDGSKPMILPYEWVNNHPLTSFDFGYNLGSRVLTHNHVESGNRMDMSFFMILYGCLWGDCYS